MTAEKVVEPAITEWTALIVFAPKKNGSLRFYVLYYRLRAVTTRYSYLLPRTYERMNSLEEAILFTTLYAHFEYWKIKTDEREYAKTAFTSDRGFYRFIGIPFGPKNAPVIFKRAMDVILDFTQRHFGIFYLDDIVVFS